MHTLMIAAIAVAVAAFSVALYRFVKARTWAKHDPVEYFSSWGGYTHPIGLYNQITKEEVEARTAKGEVYLIGEFDADNRLVRATKMYRNTVFFDFIYTYYPNGTRRSAKITNNRGKASIHEYDTWGRGDQKYFW